MFFNGLMHRHSRDRSLGQSRLRRAKLGPAYPTCIFRLLRAYMDDHRHYIIIQLSQTPRFVQS
jgi:hypothetical protein